MKKIKSIIAVILILNISLFTWSIALASENKDIISIESMKGAVFYNGENRIIDSYDKLDATLNKAEIIKDNEGFIFSGELTYNGKSIQINTHGYFLPSKLTKQYDTKIVAEVDSTEEFDIECFQIDSNSNGFELFDCNYKDMLKQNVLYIGIKDRENNVIYFQHKIDQYIFKELYTDAKKNYDTKISSIKKIKDVTNRGQEEEKLEKKRSKIEFWNNDDNYFKGDTNNFNSEIENIIYPVVNNQKLEQNAMYKEDLEEKTLLTSSELVDDVDLYPVPDSIFNSTNNWEQWTHVNNLSGSYKYFYSYYKTYALGTTNIRTFIIVCDLILRPSWSGNDVTINYQIEVKHNKVVDYFENGNVYEVMDSGCYLMGFKQGTISTIIDETVLVEKYYTGTVDNMIGFSDVVKACLVFVPYANSISWASDYLITDEETEFNKVRIFPGDYNLQKEYYNNEVIRGDEADYSNYKLESEGEYVYQRLVFDCPSYSMTYSCRYSYTVY